MENVMLSIAPNVSSAPKFHTSTTVWPFCATLLLSEYHANTLRSDARQIKATWWDKAIGIIQQDLEESWLFSLADILLEAGIEHRREHVNSFFSLLPPKTLINSLPERLFLLIHLFLTSEITYSKQFSETTHNAPKGLWSHFWMLYFSQFVRFKKLFFHS